MPSEAQAVVAPYQKHFSHPAAEVASDLESFCELLAKWQQVQNLVSRETLADVWSRHIADSLQILPLLRAEDRVFLDLGSGGGFPALPLAIACKGGPQRFVLVEPNGRKASFLRAAARQLELAAIVESRRSEQLDPAEIGSVDVITSRALAPLKDLCTLLLPFFGPKTRAILHKGREHVDELAESDAVWHHDVLVTRSVTDPGGVLLQLTNLSLRLR